jgi:hypothetical protein
MRGRLLLGPMAALLAAAVGPLPPAAAVDHNNVDAGRPLSFEDAESIAYRERAVEGGIMLRDGRGRRLGAQAHLGFLYGFALNSHLGMEAVPAVGGRPGSDRTGTDLDELSIGAFHNFNREYDGRPALSLRGDVSLPVGREARGLGVRLRGIASRAAGQYGRLHLNVDLPFEPDAERGERELQPALLVGYTHPLGHPRRFDRTGLAELGVRSGATSGSGPVFLAGIGLRQQMTVRSVFDVGLEADIAGGGGAPRDRFRLAAGYSVSY